jgi:hypothetical protein
MFALYYPISAFPAMGQMNMDEKRTFGSILKKKQKTMI